MPGSAVSHGSGTGSKSSQRARTRQYRTVSHKSHVDEALFGASNKSSHRQGPVDNRWVEGDLSEPNPAFLDYSAAGPGTSGKPKKQTVQVITKDLIRNLVIPEGDPSGESVILSFMDFQRIKDRARVLTAAEREAMLEHAKLEKEAKQTDAAQRKAHIQMLELNRVRSEPLNDLEEEAKQRAQHLLERANEQRQEQEDEIKHLNEVILNAKCHAIRDAQILEKKVVKGEMQGEEKRLDAMMEVDRENAIRMQEEIERKRREERLVGAAQILEQISQNEQDRLFELERKDQENIQMQKYLEKLMEEDRMKLEKKHQEQTILREQLNAANAALLDRKTYQKEQEKVLELRVIEYQKQKAEREAAFEREQERVRIEKEKEVARLRGLQERAQDEQAARDMLRAKRATEQAEREWRRKEADETRKKAEVEATLKVARSEQMNQKEHFLAVQAQRERADFERVLRAQKELIEKEQREEAEMSKKRLRHRDEVLGQIREKEQGKIAERNAFFDEGIRLDEEARTRRVKLDEVKQKKLGELRAAGIPEKYLAQVERKIGQPQLAH